MKTNLTRSLRAVVAASLLLAPAWVYGGTVTINFDDVPDGTVLDSHYAGLTFANSIGGSIYARSDLAAPSQPNSVSVMSPAASFYPGFDARWGAVQVTFATPASSVSVDTVPTAAPEGFPPYIRRPYLQVYNTSGTLLTTIYYSLPLPSVGDGTLQTLSYNAGSAVIGKVLMSSEAPNGYAPTYAHFDNLTYVTSSSYSLYTLSQGAGSVSASPSQPTYPSGTVVSLTATPVSGWLFSGWSGDVTSTDNPLQVTMTANLSLTAHFIPHGVNTVTFDTVANGTLINTYYPGLVFTNPIGGNIFARYSLYAPSPTNVVSVFQTGLPEFNAYWGAVDVYLSVPVRAVSIDARPELPPEALSPATKKPFLQAFDTAGNLMGTVYYAGPLPTTPGAIGPTETLTFTSSSANIGRARFSAQNPSGSTPTYALLDNFSYDAGVYTLAGYAAGGGSLTITPQQSTYAYGSPISLKATPAMGWLFNGWSGSASGLANPLSFSMLADASITANFTSTVSNLIIDDSSAEFYPYRSLVWSNATVLGAYNDHCHVTAAQLSSTTYAIYTPNIPVTGNYDIWMMYPNTSGYGTDNAGVLVHHDGLNNSYTVDQSFGGSPRWTLVASNVRFAQGTSDYLKLYSKSTQTGKVLVADAFRLTWSATQTVPPLKMGTCLPGPAATTLTWSAIPGRIYQVQYKNSLTDAQWTTLSGDVTATDWTASKQDTTAVGQARRYYRLVMLPQ